jgi:hypothetical protein
MKKVFIILFISALTIILFNSCERENSNDVNQDRIYVLYELIYTQSTDVTSARASFFFGSITGTKLELVAPSKVDFNGSLMGFKSVLAYYETQISGLRSTGDFSWTTTEDTVFINSATIKQVGLPATVDTIFKGQAYELAWIGDALSTGESVYAFVDGSAENDAINVIQSTPSATKIIITAAQTNNLSVGTNTIFLRRNNITAAQNVNSAGASCSGVYETNTINVEVK